MRDRRAGSLWLSVFDDNNGLNQQVTTPVYKGAGVLRAVVANDGNVSGRSVVNVFDGTMSARQVSAPGTVPQIGRPLFVAGPPAGAQGYAPLSGLCLEFYEGLILSFGGANQQFVLLIYDPW